MNKVYEMVTERIKKELEKGIIPWSKPWQGSNKPINWKTGKTYRGVNRILLPPGEYASFKQIQEAGGNVKKGEKAYIAIFWKLLEKENPETGKIEHIPYLRYYNVFEINTQCDGIRSKIIKEEKQHDPLYQAEKIVEGYKDKPEIKLGPAAYYIPSEDAVYMPKINSFIKIEEYYKVLFHELVHSTGHSSRLNREGIKKVAFGSEVYSKEELIAELGASFLASEAELNYSVENTAAYIQSWLKALKDDVKLIVHAAANAEKAVDYIFDRKYNNED